MLLTQEPTFVIFMVVTQEPTMIKNYCHSCISNHGMNYCNIPSLCKAPATKPKVLKRINAQFQEDMQQVKLGGMFGHKNTKFYSSFIYHLSLLFLFYPSIKPLISIIFMTKYGLPCYFPNHLFLSILSEFVVNY